MPTFSRRATVVAARYSLSTTVEARMAVARGQRQHRAHGELALVHGTGTDHGAQHIDGALVHMAGDLRQIGGGQAVLLHDLQQTRRRPGAWRQEACHLNEVSAVAQRVPDAVREARGIGSVDMLAARPCGPVKMSCAPVKPSLAR
jgi:hypothetical protein